MKQFTSLHNHDRYSMLDGLRPPEEFLTKAKEIGMTAYAQTNHGSMSGFFDFYDAAKKIGIKPIFGVEAYFVNNKLKKGEKVEIDGKEKTVYEKPRHIVLLAKNIKGYRKLLKAQYHACKEGMYYRPRIDWDVLKELAGDVIVSSACSAGIIAAPIVNKNIQEAKEVAMKLKDIFKDDFYIEYIALERTDNYGPIWAALRDIAKELKIRSIITLDVHYPNKEDAFYQDLLHCVSTKYTIDDIKSKTAWTYEDRDLYLKNYDEAKMIMSRVFNEKHVEKFLDNTNEVASKIEEFNIYPEGFVLPKVGFEEAKLKEKMRQGFKERTDSNKKDIYLSRLNYEYKIVKKLGFLEYFWIVQDVVNWSKNQGIEVGAGRGSAAGSLISYLLGITDIDPIKFNLSFERFLNPTRKKMPDIDIDFSQARRSEVFEYMKTYGEDKVAHIANLVGFTEKLAFQDIGKIYKIPYDEVCRVTKNMEEFGVPDKYKKEHEVAKKIMGNYRHYSQHAGGIVVTDKPIYEYLPTVNLKQEVQTGINGDTLQKKGFLKIDVLALTDLDILRSSINYVKKYEGKDIDILNIDIEDPNVLKLFEVGDTDSIFQFNTYPFKCLLKEAQPRKFKHLAELNAVNRPNAKKLGYDTEYVKRRFMKDERIPAAPKIIGDHLKDTFNLLLYQEQLMNILADWLDIDHGYADNLRRDIEGDSFMPVMNKYKQQLFKKYGEQDTMEAMRYLQEAAGYSFNKSHSVSYAYVAYQMAYMKVYYRKYFNLAVFNIEKDLPKIESTITDCKKHNIPIKPWNINDFSFDFYVNSEGQIVPGVKVLKGIGEKSALPIYQNKPYRDADDFLNRSKARKNIVEALYKFKFFERAFGKVENSKIKEYLDNKEAAKQRAKFKANKKKVEKDIL